MRDQLFVERFDWIVALCIGIRDWIPMVFDAVFRTCQIAACQFGEWHFVEGEKRYKMATLEFWLDNYLGRE